MSARAKFAWSVRRELWEHPAIYLAPLAVAGLALLGFAYRAGGLAARMRELAALDAAKRTAAMVTPYALAASAVIVTCFLVGLFFCLDALHGERRDRGIYFWKSMPVSDLATVCAKAFVPLALLPAIAWTIALAVQAVMLAAGMVVLAAGGGDPAAHWAALPLGRMSLVMLYGLAAHVLWYAPIFAALLLVSAWARRSPFLWAVVPPLAIVLVEKLALGTTAFASLMRERVVGAAAQAFVPGAMDGPITEFAQLDPARLLASPQLWGGLLFAAACLAAAVRLRRSREPN